MLRKEVTMNELEKEILHLINEQYPLNFINIKSITNEMYQCLGKKVLTSLELQTIKRIKNS